MLLLLLAQVQYSTAQLDPVKNFCRRFGHQTALIDRRLYVDGGMLNYGPLSQYPANYSNTGLLYHDLDKRGPGNMPKLVAGALSKNATVPSVSGGTLWTDDINKRFYLFGGEYYQQPTAPPFVPQYVLWSYDVLNDRWDSLGPPTRANVGGVAYGAGVTISERGEGFYYGGWKSNSSVAGWSGPPLLSTGMVKYTMESNDWRNDTGPDSVGRAEGSMVFLPISDGGMLVYLGGVKQENNSVVGQSMEEILLYDVLSSSWYKQNATGQIPQMRRKFCAGAAWAQDQSSYNIYIYGGAGMEPDTSGFDDVYILTIPSFQWIKMFPDDGNVTGPNPHHSLTCNVVDYAQMLVLGGTFPTSDTCDIPNSYGLHNLDMGKQNYEKAGWYIYESNVTSYAVPDLVIKAVGGSGTGGAMKTVPEKGFDNRDLRVLMTRKANLPTRTPTRAIPTATGGPENKPSYLSTGAIAGIAVGSAAVLAGILGSCWFIQRHRRRRLAENAASGTWSPQTANAGLGPRTPNSPPQRAPFIQRQPVELPVEPPPGVNTWLGPDGVTYELVTNPSFVATSSNTIMNESIAGTGTGTGTGMGTNYSNNEQQTKIDSEGRLWVQVFPSPSGGGSVISGAGSPGSGGGGGGGGLGLGLYATNGTAGTGYSPVASGGGGSPRTPRTPVGYSSSPQVGPPQELGAEPSREGDVGSQALREGYGWDAAHGRPRHHTYYHP